MDDLRRMAVFAAVVRHGSMSGAARALAISPSAVSQQIQQLERDGGVTLLLRSTRKLALTAAGEPFYEACAAMVSSAERARSELDSSRAAPRGELRISAPIGFLRHAQAALSELLQDHPELKLCLLLSDTRTDLIKSRIDMAVIFGSLPDSDWSARRLCSIDFWLCASPAYLKRHGTPLTPPQLLTHQWLWFGSENRPVRVVLSRPGAPSNDICVAPRIASDNQEALQQSCLAGMGIASLSSLDVCNMVDSGLLVRLLPDWTTRAYDIWAVTPQRYAQPAKVKHAIQALHRHLLRAPGARA